MTPFLRLEEILSFNLFRVAVKNLKRKSFRTGILILSIGLLVSILVFGSSFIISVGSSIQRASDRLGADLLVVPMGARDFAEEALLETEVKTFYMDRSIIDRVEEIEGIDEVTHQTYISSILGLCCDIPEAKIVAFDQDTDFILGPWLKKAIGRKLEGNEIIIGREAFDNYDLLDVDRSVFFNITFDIVGVLEKTGTGLDNAIFMSEESLDDIIAKSEVEVRPDQISLIFTKLKQGYDPVEVGRRVEGEIIQVDVIERSDMGKRIITTLKDINRVFLITILLASLLSVFLTWTIFSAIVNERFREVGIMRAIGAKGSHIVRMFVIEVLLMGLFGSMVGIALGTYMSMSISDIFILLRDMAATLTMLERVEIGLLGLVVGTGICIVGALSSILRIRRLEPLTALKEV
jgi:putative ABC transport system permease protein